MLPRLTPSVTSVTSFCVCDPKGMASGNKLAIVLNDMQSQKVAANTGESDELPLKPQAIQQGLNQLKLTITQRGEAVAESLTIENVRVLVRYQSV